MSKGDDLSRSNLSSGEDKSWSKIRTKIQGREVVDLSGKKYDNDDLESKIIPALKENKSVRQIILNNNKLGSRGLDDDLSMMMLSLFLKDAKTVERVELDNNHIGYQGMIWLISALENISIKYLSVKNQTNARSMSQEQEKQLTRSLEAIKMKRDVSLLVQMSALKTVPESNPELESGSELSSPPNDVKPPAGCTPCCIL